MVILLECDELAGEPDAQIQPSQYGLQLEDDDGDGDTDTGMKNGSDQSDVEMCAFSSVTQPLEAVCDNAEPCHASSQRRKSMRRGKISSSRPQASRPKAPRPARLAPPVKSVADVDAKLREEVRLRGSSVSTSLASWNIYLAR